MKAFTKLSRNLYLSFLTASNYQVAVTFQMCLLWAEVFPIDLNHELTLTLIQSFTSEVSLPACARSLLLLDTHF